MRDLLGAGLLSWPNYERMGGRYGMVALFSNDYRGLPWNVNVDALVGLQGSLIAVLDDQEFDLGSGTFFTEQDYGMIFVGLKPDDGRKEEWLNFDNLCKVDGVLTHKPIELYFQSDTE